MSFNRQAIEEIMKLTDKNQDGKIDYIEFLQTISDLWLYHGNHTW